MERCDHCRRILGDNSAYDPDSGMMLCSDKPGQPDCYALVTRHGHQKDCKPCAKVAVAES